MMQHRVRTRSTEAQYCHW